MPPLNEATNCARFRAAIHKYTIYKTTQIHEYPNTQLHKYANTKIHKIQCQLQMKPPTVPDSVKCSAVRQKNWSANNFAVCAL